MESTSASRPLHSDISIGVLEATLPENAVNEGLDFSEPVLEYETTDNLDDLLGILPPNVTRHVRELVQEDSRVSIVEIILDLGRIPEARFTDFEVALGQDDVTREDLLYVADRIGDFGEDNRAGIERTLHRISAIRNRSGEIVGLTCRIGRAVFGTIAIIRDLIETGESLLLVGRPGVGKTTMLRETARVLAGDFGKRVIVVDTSNEIAGDGDIPHPAIGRARRMQVPTPTAQHDVMIEAVENHMPQVIVIDEIGTELEAMAARTIAERGVQLIGTAHGNSLENLMLNPTLSDLIGGIQSVTLSDEEARRRGTQKSILERKAPPTFGLMVELLGRDEVAVHLDVAATVDVMLRGVPARPEIRRRAADGTLSIQAPDDNRRDPMTGGIRSAQTSRRDSQQGGTEDTDLIAPLPVMEREPSIPTGEDNLLSQTVGLGAYPGLRGRGVPGKPLRIYPFGVSRNRLEQAIRSLGLVAVITRDARESDMVMTLKNYYRTKPQPVREAENRGTPVYVLRSNTIAQMQTALSPLVPSAGLPAAEGQPVAASQPPVRPLMSGNGTFVDALEEAEDAIGAVMRGMPSIALNPQSKHVRRMQHELADRYNVGSRSRGKEPNRRVEIFRGSIY